MSQDSQAIEKIVADFDARPEMLVQILHGVQAELGRISEATVRQLAASLNLSRAEVHGVVSYYHDFHSEASARHIVKVCAAEACQAMGGRELARHASSTLGIGMDGRNEEFQLEPIYCLGNCACAPAVMIDGKTYGRVSPERFDDIVAAAREARS